MHFIIICVCSCSQTYPSTSLPLFASLFSFSLLLSLILYSTFLCFPSFINRFSTHCVKDSCLWLLMYLVFHCPEYSEYSVLNIHWKDWCWSWSSSTLATWWKELTHWKRPWCWEGLKAGGEGDDRGWDGWMASLTWWTWIWASSVSWWWIGKPGMLLSMGSQRVGHKWVTELNCFHCNRVREPLSLPNTFIKCFWKTHD